MQSPWTISEFSDFFFQASISLNNSRTCVFVINMWLLFSNMLVTFLFKFPLKQHEMQNTSWLLFENNSDAFITIALDWSSWCVMLNPVIWILSFSSRGVTAATTLSITVKQHQQLWSLPIDQTSHYKHLVLISLKFMKVTTGKTACYTFPLYRPP